MASTEIEQYLKPADAGYNINPEGEVDQSVNPVNPFYNRNQTEAPRTYDEVRGNDKIDSVINNSLKLQFTEDEQNNYLRLLMPMYSRRVEVEDLNRNFWVIGQAINFISEKIKLIDSGGIDPGIERLRFEKTIEKDRDGHDYSNYPHKITFNEGYLGLKTPYMVIDYCYRSDELDPNFEGEAIWYRQFGGINSADNAYIVGGGGNTPFLNLYKPRPDAIPIFNLIQTESSDTESFNAGDYYKKFKNTNTDETIYMNFLGKTNDFVCDGDNIQVSFENHFSEDWYFEPTNATHGQIIISNVPELTPLRVHQGDSAVGKIAGTKATVTAYSTGSPIEFEQFTEGQIIKFEAVGADYQYNGWYVKTFSESTFIHGYRIPTDYVWKKWISSSDYDQLPETDKKDYICQDINSGAFALNYVDQKFMCADGVWKALDSVVLRDGPTVPEYRVVENGSAFRVLGDSSREITEGSSTKPIINYKEIATANIHPHDVVRYIDPNGPTYGKCFEWWDGKWREIKNCDASYVNIFLWLPQKTNTLRGVYYWTLKWLIPPGLVEY